MSIGLRSLLTVTAELKVAKQSRLKCKYLGKKTEKHIKSIEDINDSYVLIYLYTK